MKAPLLLAMIFLFLAALETGLRLFLPSQSLWLELTHPPESDRVLIIGNSMFKTGIDLESFEATTGHHVDFNYFDGYYTNLWFLIFKNAILQADEQPETLIWGFRPNYAIIPAFRQRKAGYIERFRSANEPEYEAISASTKLPWTERVDLLLANSKLYSLRAEARSLLLQRSKELGIGGLSLLNDRYREESMISKTRDSSVGDLLLAAVTRDHVQMSEELVADVASPQDSRFITGNRTEFAQSFVPHIAAMLKSAGIPQLVVIFKPASELSGKTAHDVIQFKNDSVVFFRDNGIPVANVFDDLDLSGEDFGSGDHYNGSGRGKVTKFVAKRHNEEFQRD